MSTDLAPAEASPNPPPKPPPGPTPADFDGQIHVSQWGNHQGSNGTLPIIVQSAIGLSAVAILLVYEGLHKAHLPVPVVHGILTAAALFGLGWAVLWLVRWYRRNQKIGGPGFKPDDRYRVRLIGPPERTATLIPAAAGSFEPVVVYAWLGIPPPRAGVIIWAAASAVIALAWFGLRRTPVFGLPGFGYWGVMACVGVGGILAALATPTYFRVVPGRLDVMRFNFFRSRRPSLRTYDLRRGRLLVDVRYRLIYWEPPEAPGAPPPAETVDRFGRRFPKRRSDTLEITTLLLPGARDLARAVLEGAVSTAPTPPLPEDELVG